MKAFVVQKNLQCHIGDGQSFESEGAVCFAPIGVKLEHTVCRYTPRKIRAIAATSWKQKDWLAPPTVPANSPLPGQQNPRTRRKRPARAITGGTIGWKVATTERSSPPRNSH